MDGLKKRGRRTIMALLGGVVTVEVLRRVAALRPRQPPAGTGYRQSLLWRLYDGCSQFLDHTIGWDKLPMPVGLAVLIGVRNILRQRNLQDTTHEPAVNRPEIPPSVTDFMTTRTANGSYNDLSNLAMGMAGSRFGRNVPIEHTYPDPEPALLTPDPRTVSRELLTRDPFQPATSVNALVAAWLQFMVRDWLSHGKSVKDNPFQLPLQDDDPWPDRPMTILRTAPDPTRPPAPSTFPPTYVNTETHWWDASQMYGSNQAFQTAVRAGQDGKLLVDADGLVPLPSDPARNPALVPGWWLGVSMMHTLFTLEHNAICDRLRADYPSWSDDDLFHRARLITAALLAKIHTVEWTPAVISHPTTAYALKANWWGIAMEQVHRLFGRISASEIVSGIPGSETNHFGVPYALTEEFTAVYRMHPLIPDDYSFRSATDDSLLRELTFADIAGPHAEELLHQLSMTDLLYTFGTMHPGLVTLHNYPRFLQQFERPDGRLMDLAATDILRHRELGVPRYNEFRRQLHLAPATSFEELTGNPVWAQQIRRVYDDNIERVDLMVGLFAERLPEGFAFSDTAFRIFILMASRRLNSDRFFTKDYTPRVYTQAGMDWIDNNTMSTVLLRHYPQLRTALRDVTNAFVPWSKAGVAA